MTRPKKILVGEIPCIQI